MATITTHLTNSTRPKQIRPLDPRRDLSRVADLIELCFSETLDPDGQRYIQRMRQSGKMAEGRWFNPPSFSVNMIAEGFIWQENGEIVGNISLIPFSTLSRKINLIANVAVHPDFRRRGIARALTVAALEQAQTHHIRSIWLQVRDTNETAFNLYKSLGFVEKARRTTWTLLPGKLRVEIPSGGRIVHLQPRHWKNQRKWFKQNYPDELLWYWPISLNAFRPGLLGMFFRAIYETQMRQWCVEQSGQLRGILSWKTTRTYADQLWLSAPSDGEDLALRTLLPHIHWRERSKRPLSLDFPEKRAENTLHAAGFHPDHTLIWMEI
jgi:GNAT superfamily N-acetyltransferase